MLPVVCTFLILASETPTLALPLGGGGDKEPSLTLDRIPLTEGAVRFGVPQRTLPAAGPAPLPSDLKLDFTPLKGPMEKCAAQLERAVQLAETARGELFVALNWTLVGVAVVVTVLVVHTIHLRALAASKVNLSLEKKSQ